MSPETDHSGLILSGVTITLIDEVYEHKACH